MKKKEIKQLAKLIAEEENIISNSETAEEEIEKAKNEILRLSKKLKSLEDILEVDAYVQEYLQSKDN